MQLYGTPSKSRINLKKIISWKPSSSCESYEACQPTRRHDEIPDAIADEIVKTIFDKVDSRVEELFKKSARPDREEDTDEREENEGNCETSGVRYLRESDRDVAQGETQTEEDDVSESLISRENATDANTSVEDSKEEDAARVRRNVRSKEHFTSVPNISMRRKSESNNYLHPDRKSVV